MTHRNLLAGTAVALGLMFSAPAAFAASHADTWFKCETFMPSKAAHQTTHCVTWTRDAKARMQANCDPAKTSDAAAMRARCAELSANPDRTGAPAA